MALPPLSDTEVADFVLAMTSVERSVMLHFVNGRGRLYSVIAEKSGTSYAEVQATGRKLQNARLASTSVSPFNGCRLFLNHRGEQVKRAVEILQEIKSRRKNIKNTKN